MLKKKCYPVPLPKYILVHFLVLFFLPSFRFGNWNLFCATVTVHLSSFGHHPAMQGNLISALRTSSTAKGRKLRQETYKVVYFESFQIYH